MSDTDLEADVRAAIEGSDVAPAPAPVEALAGELETEAPEPKPDAQGRVRAPDGKFAPKQVDEQAKVEQPALAPAQEPETAILPPHSLKAAVKAVFATLPKDVQDEFLRIEGEAQKAKTEWSGKGEQYNRFEKLFEPISDRLTLSGMTRETYTAALIRADEMLRKDPAQALPMLAQMYGFNIPGLQAPQQPLIDPAIQSLQQTVSQLQQQLQSRETSDEQGKMQAAQSELEAFRSDPKHLYFDNVRQMMGKFIEMDPGLTLADAYDRAVYADPQIRALVAASPQPKAQPAKPKDISVTGAQGQTVSAPPKNSRTSIEDDVRAALEESMGRV